jgi:hypothetical protein
MEECMGILSFFVILRKMLIKFSLKLISRRLAKFYMEIFLRSKEKSRLKVSVKEISNA